jgi:hypothetical protein
VALPRDALQDAVKVTHQLTNFIHSVLLFRLICQFLVVSTTFDSLSWKIRVGKESLAYNCLQLMVRRVEPTRPSSSNEGGTQRNKRDRGKERARERKKQISLHKNEPFLKSCDNIISNVGWSSFGVKGF